MALYVLAGWDFATAASGVGYAFSGVDNGGGGGAYSITAVTSGTYCHVDAQISGNGLYDDFATKLKTDLDAASSSATAYTVTFDETTLKYTISHAANFSMVFAGTAQGTHTKNLLGFSGNKSGANTYTSDYACYYAIAGTQGGLSMPKEYQPSGMAVDAEANDGSPYMHGRATAVRYKDFVIQFEPLAKVRSREAATAVPWTWEHFFDHCRAGHPFVVIEDGENTIHTLRADGASWDPANAEPDIETWFHVPFRTRVRGFISGAWGGAAWA